MNSRVILILSIIYLLIFSSYSFAGVDGLVLYFPFDGNVKDASGNSNDGVIKGNAKWVAGKFKEAMEFDGATYVEVADKPNSGLDGVPGLTIEVWVNMKEHHDNGIVVKLLSGAFWPCSYNLETWSDQLAYFDINADIGSYTTANYPLNEWFHLVGVFDGSADKIYVDGELKSTNPRPEKIVPDGDMPVYIGCVAPGQYFFKGMLDDLAIYKRALSQQEIIQDMNAFVTPVENKGKIAIAWGEIKSQN
ncbi:TPA: LamG domain-containing protein [Candidatus Poribacteria bacterium]|nr:LamG domain-containing protein [Candidatus Poribacteria bacterium]